MTSFGKKLLILISLWLFPYVHSLGNTILCDQSAITKEIKAIQKLEGNDSLTLDEQYIQLARSILNYMSWKFESDFDSSNFTNYELFHQYLRENLHLFSDTLKPLAREMLESIELDQFDFITAAPKSIRLKIAKNGFLNQYQSKNSRGILEMGRISAEHSLSGYDYYNSVPLPVRPKYGNVIGSQDSFFQKIPINSQYGSDIYIFKKEVLQDRVSFTMNDSYHLKVTRGLPPHWSSKFIPWKYRLMLFPFTVEKIKHSNDQTKYSLGGNMEGPIASIEYQKLSKGFSTYGDTEIQIWGPLSLNDVKAFIFTKKPPQERFFIELKNRNIKIYDGRKAIHLKQLDELLEWQP